MPRPSRTGPLTGAKIIDGIANKLGVKNQSELAAKLGVTI